MKVVTQFLLIWKLKYLQFQLDRKGVFSLKFGFNGICNVAALGL